MGEVLSQGLSKEQRKPILDAARNRRWEEVGTLLDGVSDAVALTRFRTFAEMNWAKDLRGDTKTLTDAVSRRIAAVGGKVGSVATAPTQVVAAPAPAPAKPVTPAVPEIRGPAQGAKPKVAVLQTPVRPPQAVPAPAVPQAPSAAPDRGFRGKVVVETPVVVAPAVAAGGNGSARKEQAPPPPSRGPAPGAKPRTEVYAPPVTRSREGR